MLYQTRLKSVFPGGAIDANGNTLQFIGNLPAEAGSQVWTDGKYIYGNEHIREECFLPIPENEAIPVRATDYVGFVNKRGRLKKADIIDDAYILNGEKEFFHGSEEVIDSEVAKDEDDNEIGVYTAIYNKAETTGTIGIRLGDETVQTINLDDYKDEDIAEAKASKTVESENIECMQFHLNTDGSWEMIVCETAVLKEELSPNGKPPEPLMIGNKTYHEHIMDKIKTYTHPTQAGEPPDTFGDIIYSQEAYLLNGSDNVEDNLNCQNSPLANDVQVWDKLINRLIAYNIYAHEDEQAIVDYSHLVNLNPNYPHDPETLPRLWMKIQRLATTLLCTNQICPNCGKPMDFDDSTNDHVYGVGPLAKLVMHCDETRPEWAGEPGCGHRERSKIDLGGAGIRLRFNKFDTASSDENCRYQKFYKLSKVNSDGEIEVLDDHQSVPLVDDWTFTSQQELTSETWVRDSYHYNTIYTTGPKQVRFDSLGSDYTADSCCVPSGRGATVSIEFMAGIKSVEKKYLVYTSSPAYIYRPYERIYLPKYYNTELADSWEWNLNDGYVAEVNRFKVLSICDAEGNQICGELPFQWNQEDIPLLSLPYDDENSDYKDDKNVVYYANDEQDYEKTNSLGYRNYPYNSSLAVQKLKNGYLISFHGYKLYKVDNEGEITELGNATKNTRLNFLKKLSKAKAR